MFFKNNERVSGFKAVFSKVLALSLVFAMFAGSAFAMSKPVAASQPQRIVSLSPAATEILFAVGAGDKVVAVDEFSDYPAEAKELPKVGGFDGKTLSIEKILSFEPDFVYITKGMHDFLIEPLEKYGIQYYISTGESVDSVRREINDVGAVAGSPAKAAEAVKVIDDAIAQANKAFEAGGTEGEGETSDISVYYEVWNAPYMSVGGNTFISDVITTAGGKNIFADLADWPSVSEEAIIAGNPDVILIPASSGVTAADVASRAGWSDISAVKNNKVFVVDDNLYSRPSPRIGETISQLSDLLNK